MAKDPVCGMSVQDGMGSVSTVHQGTTYYFCSGACKAAFEKAPEKYAAGRGLER